jgi:hypothetical protein
MFVDALLWICCWERNKAMTEAEWMTCTNSRPMLEFLHGKVSDRKLRLFTCGFCQSIDALLWDDNCRDAVQVAELFADGLAGPEELEAACQLARLVWAASSWEGMLAAAATESDVWTAANGVQSALEMDDIPRKYWKRQSDFLRDIFGPLPFRPVIVNSSWLAWNDDIAVKLAQGIYDEQAFDRLPILADALEDAGCDNADILNHLRSPSPHVRGCFALDLLLGKK